MQVFLNNRFVPEAQAVIPISDRGFRYGDGLFETIRVFRGKPFRWTQHLERLRRGAEFLHIQLPFTTSALRKFAGRLVALNQMPDALLRLTLSRGPGPRGYSPKGAVNPTLVISTHPAPAGADACTPSPSRSAGLDIPRSERTAGRSRGRRENSAAKCTLILASPRLPAGDPLAQFKTCNKLPQIVARLEADAAGADEALLMNTDGHVVEGGSSNLFWIDDNDVVCTPPLAAGVLPGITRAAVLELCRSLGVRIHETSVSPAVLKLQRGIFLTLSSRGLVEAGSFEGRAVSPAPLVARLHRGYRDLVRAETA